MIDLRPEIITHNDEPLAREANRYARYLYNRYEASYTALARAHRRAHQTFKIKGLRDKIPLLDTFCEELFASLFQNPEKVQEGQQWAKDIMDIIEQDPSWLSLKMKTSYDAVYSAVATKELLTNLDAFISDVIKEEEQLRQGLQGASSEGYDNAKAALSAMVTGAIATANEKVEKATAISNGCGDGDVDIMTEDDRLSLVTEAMDSNILQSVLMMAGRLKSIAVGLSGKVPQKDVKLEASGVTNGGNLSATLPREFMSHNRLLFEKWQQQTLLQQEFQAEDNIGLGPLIILVDRSGSMSGHRDMMASSISTAMVAMAMLERDCYIIGFNSAITDKTCFMHNEDAVKGYIKQRNGPRGFAKTRAEALKSISSFSALGGTNFTEPIYEAVNIINNEEEFSKADVILITDGQAKLRSSKQLNKSVKDGVRFYCISIEEEPRCTVLKNLLTAKVVINDWPLDSEENINAIAGIIANSVDKS